jgi:hypothetical protein
LLLYAKIVRKHNKKDMSADDGEVIVVANESPGADPVKALTDLLYDCSDRVRNFTESVRWTSQCRGVSIRVAQRQGRNGTVSFGTVVGCSTGGGSCPGTKGDKKGTTWKVRYNGGAVVELSHTAILMTSAQYRTAHDQDPEPLNAEHMILYQEYSAKRHCT